ncbi:MAG: hypothetical protein HW421_3329 [Ignavibacteria bacterium]|nr:hypothetical protein [Ignavibacteria bacterium]
MKYLFLLFVFLLINTNLLASNQYFVYDSISHEVILKKQVDTTIKLSDFFDLYLLNEQENFNDNLIFDSSFNSRFQPYQIFKKLKTNEFSRKKMWGRIKLVNELNESQELILYFSNSDTTYFFEVRRNKLINTKFRVSETKNNLDIYRPGDNYKIYLLPKDTVIYYLKNYSVNFWYYSDVSSRKYIYIIYYIYFLCLPFFFISWVLIFIFLRNHCLIILF